ncbi:MAG TPA: thiamine phosphate synthase [Terriglobales bacterium]|jgi:thiamine-phosphate pyrophosphorylase|nr:thiamine phosphate synthase [Terriglobales bacterium]
MSEATSPVDNARKIRLPSLYAIVDSAFFPGDSDRASRIADFAAELVTAGVTLLQYRNKGGSARHMLSEARELRRRLGPDVRLIMNDRADLCLAAAFDGVHLGQEDLSLEAARLVVGSKLVGISTHTLDQVRAAARTSADYIAVGPVFPTTTKLGSDPPLGLDGVRAARALTEKPLVAIGGINRANCLSVIKAGANSVAVISDLLQEPGKSVAQFRSVLG